MASFVRMLMEAEKADFDSSFLLRQLGKEKKQISGLRQDPQHVLVHPTQQGCSKGEY
jgi:hypothetical protein